MTLDADFAADLKRYPVRPFLREQSIWAIWVYRFGRRVLKRKPGLVRALYIRIYFVMFHIVETLVGISIDVHADIGPGLRIYHFGNIFIHRCAVIGSNCTLRHGVTIGGVADHEVAPKIGNNAEFGAYAQVLGNIRIGDGAKIGAMSLVIINVPANCTAVGVPARIIYKLSANTSNSKSSHL